PRSEPVHSPARGTAAGATKLSAPAASLTGPALAAIRMSFCCDPPMLTVTTTGVKVPDGFTGHEPYGPTPSDQFGSTASTLIWYCAVWPLGNSSPARSKKPSRDRSSEPQRLRLCPVLSVKPEISLPALPRKRNPETEDMAYCREGCPDAGSIQRATTLTPCMAWPGWPL